MHVNFDIFTSSLEKLLSCWFLFEQAFLLVWHIIIQFLEWMLTFSFNFVHWAQFIRSLLQSNAQSETAKANLNNGARCLCGANDQFVGRTIIRSAFIVSLSQSWIRNDVENICHISEDQKNVVCAICERDIKAQRNRTYIISERNFTKSNGIVWCSLIFILWMFMRYVAESTNSPSHQRVQLPYMCSFICIICT